MLEPAVQALLAAYPAFHAACRRRSLPAPRAGRPLSLHLAGILEHLDPREPIPAGELARRLRVTPATVSLQLARLIRHRLVTRTRDPADARRVLLRLTGAGARLRGSRSLLDPERVRAALARLAAPERDAAVAGVRLLARAAAELPVTEPSRPTPTIRRGRITER